MTSRHIDVPAGTRRVIDFSTTYSQNWSVEAKRGENIDAEDVEGAVFMLKKQLAQADEDAAVTKMLDSGIVVTDGTVTVTVDAADTKDLQGKYYGTLRLYLTDDGVVDWQDADFDDTPYIILNFTQGAVEAVS